MQSVAQNVSAPAITAYRKKTGEIVVCAYNVTICA